MAGEFSSMEIRTPDHSNKNGKNNHVFDDHRESDLEDGIRNRGRPLPSLKFYKKVGAEVIGTFFLIFSGCGSVLIDKKTGGSITHLGVSLVWGMSVMILIYSLGHISGAHFNPAVTLAFATIKRFPLKDIPGYIAAQILGSISAAFVLYYLFGEIAHMAATVPSGSEIQSFVLEVLITFLLMFVVCGVATDTRAVGELAGLAIGTTVAMVVIVAGPVSGASLNPARTIGSAVAGRIFTSIWIYMVAPPIGAIAGAWSYQLIRFTDEPLHEIKATSVVQQELSSHD